MLKTISNSKEFKKQFYRKFKSVLDSYVEFRNFFYNLAIESEVFVVGGFVRDTINEQKSRDLDMMVSISHKKLEELLKNSNLSYKINRMMGIKILLKDFDVDLWSIENNWAFKDSVVKLNSNLILDNISDGCFYNYDSLVINVHSLDFRVNNYNDFVNNRRLDILQKRTIYKKKNPSIESNILRAIYLNEVYGIDFTPNCMIYLNKMIENLSENYDLRDRLNLYLNKYDKYKNVMTIENVLETLNLIRYIQRNRIIERDIPGQIKLEFE